MKESGLAEYSPYANETVDRYMDEALASSDLEQSYELWKKAQWDGNTGITGLNLFADRFTRTSVLRVMSHAFWSWYIECLTGLKPNTEIL